MSARWPDGWLFRRGRSRRNSRGESFGKKKTLEKAYGLGICVVCFCLINRKLFDERKKKAKRLGGYILHVKAYFVIITTALAHEVCELT